MSQPRPAGWRALPVSLAVLGLLLAACDLGVGGAPSGLAPIECPTAPPDVTTARRAVVGTTLGNLTIELYPEAAPMATANFAALARCGFYEGITFHRVLAGFVAQTGDPATRDNSGEFPGLGTGGPGYGFAVEIPPEGLNYDPYIVAMANTGLPNSNGSQFFICLADLNSQLERTYSIFGRVVEGSEVVDAIGQVEVNDPLKGIPVDPVVIDWIVIQGAESTAE